MPVFQTSLFCPSYVAPVRCPPPDQHPWIHCPLTLVAMLNLALTLDADVCACAAGAMETRRPWETLPRPARLHHMVEDFLTSWTAQLSHVLPLQRFLSAVVGRDVRSYFGDSCLLASLTHAVLPESCQQDFVQGHGLHRPLVFHSAATKDI